MKFINYLEKVSGVDFMGLLSLTICFMFFAGMLIWVLKTKKSDSSLSCDVMTLAPSSLSFKKYVNCSFDSLIT